jgi:N-acetyl sugar amidotransferase
MKKLSKNQCCVNCVMDTSDPEISFDINGVCNHCQEFEAISKSAWFPNEEGKNRWELMSSQIKKAGFGNEYDCILGLSGGVDSSYLALKVHEWGLRPLVVHVDAGWNSELAVSNIEAIVKYCDYDLHTHVVNWEDMRELQLAYLRSSVSNQDTPQDHIFFASLYHYAISKNIKYILSGGNIATEGIFPRSWHGSAMDSINLNAIHKRYGTKALKSYKTISFFDLYIIYPFINGLRTLRPLNYMEYNKEKALKELINKVGYKPYPRKHGESLFTKLFQNYYLPVKFNMDKRRPHYSSLIVSGQLSREDALKKLEEPLYEPIELENDISYFCKKLKITREDFDQFMKSPIHHYSEFSNWDRRYSNLKLVQVFITNLLGKKIKVFS